MIVLSPNGRIDTHNTCMPENLCIARTIVPIPTNCVIFLQENPAVQWCSLFKALRFKPFPFALWMVVVIHQ